MHEGPRDRKTRSVRADGSAGRLKRVEDKLDEYTQSASRSETLLDEIVMPSVRQTLAKLDGLGTDMHALSSGVERIGESLEVMGSDLRRTVEDHHERLQAVEREQTQHRARLAVFDDAHMSLRVKNIEDRITGEDAGDKRELALTTRRNRAFAAIIAAVSSAGGAIAGWLSGH